MDLFSHYLLIFICFLILNIYFTEVIPVLFSELGFHTPHSPELLKAMLIPFLCLNQPLEGSFKDQDGARAPFPTVLSPLKLPSSPLFDDVTALGA